MPAYAAEGNKTIDIISFNDFHGTLLSTSDTDKNMGAAKFVEAIKEHKRANPNTIVVSAGDNFNGSAASNLMYGEPAALMIRNIGVAASAVGNHEFDWGVDKFHNWEVTMGAPFIGANIYDKETNAPVDYVEPYVIQEIDGVTVGMLGLTTPETAYKTKPDIVAGIEFKDPVETAKLMVPVMKEAGCDIVVIVAHVGTSQNQDSKAITFESGMDGLSRVEGVDGIITAHSHQTVSGYYNNVPVVQAYYNGRTLAKLSFEVDANNNVVSATPSLDELYLRKAEVADNLSMKVNMEIYGRKVAPILNDIVANTDTGLAHDRYTLSPLGIWTSEVMRKSADAQIAFTNGGGLRRGLEAGDITMGDLYEVMPFDNVLSIFEMTGGQIKAVLTHGIENAEIGSVQFSGITVEYSSADGVITLNSVKLADGTELDDAASYRVVTNDFMATGGDGFTSFLSANYLGDTIAIRDAMAEAMRSEITVNVTNSEILVKN
jgi:2',3'-cyclic-nucleotide 2'-phosphodiesterase/3'-nucleotidase